MIAKYLQRAKAPAKPHTRIEPRTITALFVNCNAMSIIANVIKIRFKVDSFIYTTP